MHSAVWIIVVQCIAQYGYFIMQEEKFDVPRP
jgi:hypothetical protein